jgi:hypothetical protein
MASDAPNARGSATLDAGEVDFGIRGEHAAKSDLNKRSVLDAGTLDRAFGVKDTVMQEALRLIAYLELGRYTDLTLAVHLAMFF